MRHVLYYSYSVPGESDSRKRVPSWRNESVVHEPRILSALTDTTTATKSLTEVSGKNHEMRCLLDYYTLSLLLVMGL